MPRAVQAEPALPGRTRLHMQRVRLHMQSELGA